MLNAARFFHCFSFKLHKNSHSIIEELVDSLHKEEYALSCDFGDTGHQLYLMLLLPEVTLDVLQSISQSGLGSIQNLHIVTTAD